eukprot:Lithocolla_globosa_v1_NODE_2486_length_1983_cov_6.427386.p2 type:complete len:104 gc:universal NODE_2486_length_1983_cov_6.427386:670-359(-)
MTEKIRGKPPHQHEARCIAKICRTNHCKTNRSQSACMVKVLKVGSCTGRLVLRHTIYQRVSCARVLNEKPSDSTAQWAKVTRRSQQHDAGKAKCYCSATCFDS